jgi:hypothetical protein
MQPLTTWICDTCGEEMTDPNTSLMTWTEDDQGRAVEFLLVHKNIDGRTCDPGARSGFVSNLELSAGLGEDGAAYLLSLLSVGPLKGNGSCKVANMSGWVDLFRRLQTPWYEEARPHFDDEKTRHWLDDANEVLPYMPEVLEKIAKGTLGD